MRYAALVFSIVFLVACAAKPQVRVVQKYIDVLCPEYMPTERCPELACADPKTFKQTQAILDECRLAWNLCRGELEEAKELHASCMQVLSKKK